LQGAPEKVEDRIVMRRIRMRRTPAPPMSTPALHRQSRGFRKNGMPSLYLIAIAAMRLHQQGHFYSASRTIKNSRLQRFAYELLFRSSLHYPQSWTYRIRARVKSGA
jgi:hypothetical protein